MTWPRRTFTPPTAMTHVLKSSCVSRGLRLYRSVEDRREPTTREMKHTGAQASSASVLELNELFQPYLFKRFFQNHPKYRGCTFTKLLNLQIYWGIYTLICVQLHDLLSLSLQVKLQSLYTHLVATQAKWTKAPYSPGPL